MATKRERKHRRIEVFGHVTIDERLPRWEAELIVAALTRLQSARPRNAEEVADAAR